VSETSDEEEAEDEAEVELPEAISVATSFVKKVISSLGKIDSEND